MIPPARSRISTGAARAPARGIRLGSLLLAAALGGCERGVLAPAAVDAASIATLSWAMFLVATFVLVVTLTLIALGIALGSRTDAKAPRRRSQWILVIAGGVVAPFCAAVAITAGSIAIGDERAPLPGEAGALLEVVGKRWWWEVRYLDEEGETVAVTANEIHVPAGERSVVRLVSDNVNHSFWVPAVQGKTDLVPGRVNAIFLQPDRPGTYLGQCAEFCGTQHALMLVRVVADEPAAFDAWLAREALPATAQGPGLDVFMERGCAECHTIRGTKADGDAGPDLTHLASRDTIAAGVLPNTRGNLGGWITDTQHVKPGALMPATRMPPEDLMALLDFLQALK